MNFVVLQHAHDDVAGSRSTCGALALRQLKGVNWDGLADLHPLLPMEPECVMHLLPQDDEGPVLPWVVPDGELVTCHRPLRHFTDVKDHLHRASMVGARSLLGPPAHHEPMRSWSSARCMKMIVSLKSRNFYPGSSRSKPLSVCCYPS